MLGDPLAATTMDPRAHNREECRYITVGESTDRRILVVVHCDREERIRIISARKATPKERRYYEKGT